MEMSSESNCSASSWLTFCGATISNDTGVARIGSRGKGGDGNAVVDEVDVDEAMGGDGAD